jgi:hypothetical protein
LAWNFPPHCRLIAAHLAAGDAFAGALNEQLNPSALRPVVPAANAAPVVAMQKTKSVAAAISINNLMRTPPV